MKLSTADKALRKVEMIRNRDLAGSTGDDIDWYLDGDHMTKRELVKRLKEHRKSAFAELAAINKVLDILPDCPENV